MTEAVKDRTDAPQPDDQGPQAEVKDKKGFWTKRKAAIAAGVATVAIGIGGFLGAEKMSGDSGDAGGVSKGDLAAVSASNPQHSAEIIAQAGNPHVKVGNLQSQEDGSDSTLTLDADGYFDTKTLNEAVANYHSQGGTVNVEDTLVGVELGVDGKPVPGGNVVKFDAKSNAQLQDNTKDDPGHITYTATIPGSKTHAYEIDEQVDVTTGGHEVTHNVPTGQDVVLKSGAGYGPSTWELKDQADVEKGQGGADQPQNANPDAYGQ